MSNKSLGAQERRDTLCGRWLYWYVVNAKVIVWGLKVTRTHKTIWARRFICFSPLAIKSHAKLHSNYLDLSRVSSTANARPIIMKFSIEGNNNINPLFYSAYICSVQLVFSERKNQTDTMHDILWHISAIKEYGFDFRFLSYAYLVTFSLYYLFLKTFCRDGSL